MRHVLIMGFGPCSKFRDEMAARVQRGDEEISAEELRDAADRLLDREPSRRLVAALGACDEVRFENLAFERRAERWHVRELWDLGEAIRKCEPLARQAAQRVGDLGDAIDLGEEGSWKALWQVWQDSLTRMIQSAPDWRENWRPEHFPLEPYDAHKAGTACRRLAERYGPKPRCTGELFFWFERIVEVLP